MDFEKLKKCPQNSPFGKKIFGGINVDLLRITAVVCMLSDHLWIVLNPYGNLLNYVGRVAFPIFAFLISEGFIHTSNLKKYFVRLCVFAVFSEIPFNLFCSGEIFYPEYQNVGFTLLMGLSAVFLLDKMRKDPTPKTLAVSGLLLVGIFVFSNYFNADYGIAGVTTVVAFYLFRDFPFAWVFQLVSLVILNVFVFPGRPVLIKIAGQIYKTHAQIFAVFSLIPIWLYNGKKRVCNKVFGKVFQCGFYAFYPVHLLLLYLLFLR